MNQKLENRGDVLLQKWLTGSITWQEERELEQLAKGDAMLADAFAGFRALPENNHTLQVERLKKRLQERIEGKRSGLIFYLPRVAAAAAVIVALAFGVRYFFNINAKQTEVAAIEQQETSEDHRETKNQKPETRNEALALEEQQTTNAAGNVPQRTLSKPVTPPAENTRVDRLADTSFTIVEAESSAIAAEDKPAVTQMERAKTMNESPALQKPNAARSVAPNSVVLIERIITGKLTNTKGEPLIGVVVSADGKDTGTTTGLNGDFTLPIPPETKELVFSYTGFQTTAVPLGRNDTVKVQLKEDAQSLSEVVVSGYATNKPESKKADSQLQGKAQGVQVITSPSPRGGFDKLRSYIQKNLRYPKAAKDAKIEGKVVIEFAILPNGSLTDFKILEALGNGLDEEAIRLLKEGPKWEIRNKVLTRDVANYTIEFKLK